MSKRIGPFLSWWFRVKVNPSLYHTRMSAQPSGPQSHTSLLTWKHACLCSPAPLPWGKASCCCHQGKQVSGLVWTQVSADGHWGQDSGSGDEFPGGSIWTSVIIRDPHQPGCYIEFWRAYSNKPAQCCSNFRHFPAFTISATSVYCCTVCYLLNHLIWSFFFFF